MTEQKKHQGASAATFIEDHRWLIPYLASKSPVHSLLFTFPLWGFFLFFGSGGQFQRTHIFEFIFGVIYWSFFEYAMHRFVYHWKPRSSGFRYIVEGFHVYHHRNPEDHSVLTAGPLLAIPLTLFLGIPVFFLTGGNFGSTCRILFGTSIAYYIYEWFHFSIHNAEYNSGLLGYMQRYHLLHHHKNWNKCYSVTNPFWDIVFRTHVKLEERHK